ncbi:MAG: tetratricopeptide repeat-containing sulfotransferase family protein [Planctomycetota bacterium]
MSTFDLRARRAQAGNAFQRGDFHTAFRIASDLSARGRIDQTLREMLGICAAKTGRLKDAERLLKKALKGNSKHPGLHQAFAETCSQQGRLDEALDHYDRALGLAPTAPEVVGGKASVLERRGDTAAALTLLQPHVDRGTENAYMAAVYATALQSEGRYAETTDLILRHLGRAETDLRSRTTLCALAARVYEKSDEYAKAFEAFAMSNRIIEQPFDGDAYVEQIDNLIGTFSSENLSMLPRPDLRSELPVFVASMPRAGSTLAEQIVHAHPRACGAGEIVELDELVLTLPTRLDSIQPYPACLGDFTQEHADTLSRWYLDQLRSYDQQAARITNKHLNNYRQLGIVALLFPQARVIHCKRDPMDNCFSIYMAAMNPEAHPWATDLANLGLAYRQYERLMDHWKAVLDLEILDVQYEAIVADPDTWIRRIIDFCGLPWDDRCLRYYEAGRDVMTLSYDQVRRPIYKSAVQRYKKYEAHLGPLTEALKGNT